MCLLLGWQVEKISSNMCLFVLFTMVAVMYLCVCIGCPKSRHLFLSFISGSIKRHGGIYPPPPAALPPLAPPKKKMAKISHFLQICGFLPPQNRILPPRCSPTIILVPLLNFISSTIQFVMQNLQHTLVHLYLKREDS